MSAITYDPQEMVDLTKQMIDGLQGLQEEQKKGFEVIKEVADEAGMPFLKKNVEVSESNYKVMNKNFDETIEMLEKLNAEASKVAELAE